MKKEESFHLLYSKYYNLFYVDKNYSSEVAYIEHVIRTNHPGAKRILEYGSGTGGHGLLLKEKGYQIFGIELSQEMAEIASSKGYPCMVGNIVDFTLPEKFDVCIALFHVVSYVNSNDDLLRLFTNTRKHLSADGIFVFDAWFTPAVLHQSPEVRVKKVEDGDLVATRLATPVMDHGRNVVTVNYQVFVKNKSDNSYVEFSESHNMRHLGIPEVGLLASQTGFSLLRVEEFVSGATPSTGTWGVNFILRAK